MLNKYCGDVTIWTYPPPPYVTISHHFREPPSPLPWWRTFWTTPYELHMWCIARFGTISTIEKT